MAIVKCSAIDTRKILALCLVALVGISALGAQDNSWRDHGYGAWAGMSERERYSYLTGILVGEYGFALRYMLDNVEFEGRIPNPYNWLLSEYGTRDLYKLIQTVYSVPGYRGLMIPEIACQPDFWWDRMKLPRR